MSRSYFDNGARYLTDRGLDDRAIIHHGVDYLWNELKAHTKLVRAETYSVHEISWLVGVHATDPELFSSLPSVLLSANNTRRVNYLLLDLSIFIGR